VADFEIEDDFVYVETKSESNVERNVESKSSDHVENELRNRVLGSLVGFAISEAIGVAAKAGPTALQTEDVDAQPGLAQLVMALECLVGTDADSSMAQDDFAKRLTSSPHMHCSLTRRVVEHPKFLEEPEKTAREVWDAKSEQQQDTNSALVRAIAAGVFFQGDHETASDAAKALTAVTHNDTRSRHSGAAAALSSTVAMLLARPQADAYAVANEAFEFAAASLHEEEQEDEIYELHRHLFPADLEDLELADVNHSHAVLKALGSGFYCLTSNRIQNPLSKADAELAGNLSAAETKQWASVDDDQFMSTPLVLNAAMAGFGEALQAQMRLMESRLLGLAGDPSRLDSPPVTSSLPVLPAVKPRPSIEDRQAAFQEQITMLALEGGCSEVNCAVAGALMGAHFGLDGLPTQWVQGLGPRLHSVSALWDVLRPLIVRV